MGVEDEILKKDAFPFADLPNNNAQLIDVSTKARETLEV